MRFSEWLLSERAISVTPSMSRFARKALDLIHSGQFQYSSVDEYGWPSNPVLQAHVDGGRARKEISLFIVPDWPNHAEANPAMDAVILRLRPNETNHDYNNLLTTIEHELIHLFDPKEKFTFSSNRPQWTKTAQGNHWDELQQISQINIQNDQELEAFIARMFHHPNVQQNMLNVAKNARDQGASPEEIFALLNREIEKVYYQEPSEQDAYMGSVGRHYIRQQRAQGMSKADALKAIPQQYGQLPWMQNYADDPTTKQRWMKRLYQTVDDFYDHPHSAPYEPYKTPAYPPRRPEFPGNPHRRV